LLNGASINIPELGDELDVVVRGNDLSSNTEPASLNIFGLRLFILRLGLGAPGDSQSSARIEALVQTFTRNTAALNPAMLPQWQYLHGATFVIADRDGTLANAWIDHPESDPFLGPCAGNATPESLGNVLIYNGVVVPNGRNF
jgi:hypothetical protein